MGLMDRFLRRAPVESVARVEPSLDLQASAFGSTQSLRDETGWLVRAIGGGLTKAGVPVSEWTAMHLPVVYACVGIIADTVAQLPLNVMKKRADGGADVADGEILQELLHDEPNPHMSSFTWRRTKLHHVLLWGNGYSEIEQNGRGEAVGFWPLLPDRTGPFKDAAGDLQYRTNIGGNSSVIPADRVLHVPALGFDGYIGYSPVSMARQALGLGLAMEEFGAKFFANDAKSGGFLMHPGKLSESARQNLAQSTDKRTDPAAGLQRQGGLERAHTVKLLEEGMKFISTTIPPEDAQFLGSRDFQTAEIARMYRIPLIMLGSHEKTTSFGTGIEQLMIGFVQWTIQPWAVGVEAELNRKVFTRTQRDAGYFVKFNLNALLRGDMAARAAFYAALAALRAITPNEIRAKEDMNPVAGGDEMPIPQGAAPTPSSSSVRQKEAA